MGTLSWHSFSSDFCTFSQGRTKFARDDLKLLEVVPGDDKKFQNISRPDV